MAVRFPGTNAGTLVGTSGPLSAPYTFTCWYSISVDPDTWQTAVAATNNDQSHGILVQTDGNGTPMYIWAVPGGVFTAPSVDQNVSQWYRCAITVSGTTVTWYHGTDSGSLSPRSVTTTSAMTGLNNFWIGGDGGSPWNGRVANVKAYSAVLTTTEIEAELASWTAVRTANLVRHHRLQVPEATDYSGNGNTLTGGTGLTTEDDPPIVDSGPTVHTKTGGSCARCAAGGTSTRSVASTYSGSGAGSARGAAAGTATRVGAVVHARVGGAQAHAAAAGAVTRQTATAHSRVGGASTHGTGSGAVTVSSPQNHTKTGAAVATATATAAATLTGPTVHAETGGGVAAAEGSAPRILDRPRAGAAAGTAASTGVVQVTGPADIAATGGATATGACGGTAAVQPAATYARGGGATTTATGAGYATVTSPAVTHERVAAASSVCIATGTKFVIRAGANAPLVRTPTRVHIANRAGAVSEQTRYGTASADDRYGDVEAHTEGKVAHTVAHGTVLEA